MLTTYTVYQAILGLILVSIPALFWLCYKRPGSYGRLSNGGDKVLVPARLAWFVMEVPAPLAFVCFYGTGKNAGESIAIALMTLWMLHYVHRAFIYPMTINPRPGTGNGLEMTLEGAVYCGVNGFLNGYWIGHLADFSDASLFDAHMVAGVILFAIGYVMNKHSDTVLIRLRSTGVGYQIPHGGAYRWISCPNYFGECITWFGFAVACWSLPALSFFLFTCANLGPRAVLNHHWYLHRFENYPSQRKAILPYIL
jgi:hypothetical protein